MSVFDGKYLNTNSKGFRGKNNYSYEKTHNKTRILVLGDPFTFGDNVSDHETYSHQLQLRLPMTEIINLGVHGYGHDQMLILLKEEGLKHKPDIIILGFIQADMRRNLLNFRDYAKPKFSLHDGRLKLTNSPVPAPEDTLDRDWIRPRIIGIFSIARHVYKQKTGLMETEMLSLTAALLNEIVNLAESIDAKPVFVYLPTHDEISTNEALTVGEQFMFDLCRQNNRLSCFSTRQKFAEKLAEGASFKTDGHWDAPGHQAVAEAIKVFLLDEENQFLTRISN